MHVFVQLFSQMRFAAAVMRQLMMYRLMSVMALAFAVLAGGVVFTSDAQAYRQYGNVLPAGGCAVASPYGRCLGQAPGVMDVDYPYDALRSPAPEARQNLSPVEQHAQWMNNQRRYEELNNTLRQVPYGNVRGNQLLGNDVRYSVRPYPSYADYAYRHKRAELRTAGKPFVGVYANTGTMQLTNYYTGRKRFYITAKQAKMYDTLYAMGLTSRRRPEGAVVGRLPKPAGYQY
jgi:hypothetical protein